MDELHDYVLRMSKEELPPAIAIWSLTLYDLKNGFVIPNDRKKYNVGRLPATSSTPMAASRYRSAPLTPRACRKRTGCRLTRRILV
jgi:hypothetical protein